MEIVAFDQMTADLTGVWLEVYRFLSFLLGDRRHLRDRSKPIVRFFSYIIADFIDGGGYLQKSPSTS